jgi:hypothetical protein
MSVSLHDFCERDQTKYRLGISEPWSTGYHEKGRLALATIADKGKWNQILLGQS